MNRLVIAQDKANHVGLAKELWDYVRNRQALKAGLAKPHGVEGSDLLWTAGGALLVWVAAALTDVNT